MKPAGALHVGTVAALVASATAAIHEIGDPTVRALVSLLALGVVWAVGLTSSPPRWVRQKKDCPPSEGTQ